MKGGKIRKYAGIIIILLFLAAFIPSALNPVEVTAGSEAVADTGTRTVSTGTVSSAAGGMIFTGIGIGTIAIGTAITEAAVVAVAASQSSFPNSTTLR